MKTLYIKRPVVSALMFGASLLSISACSTLAPNPNIAMAQSRLTAAYNDKETAERGQGDLANAKAALQMAQSEWTNGDKEKSEHQLMMGQTYIDLAETRGQQAKIEQDNSKLSTQAQLGSKNQQLMAKDQIIANKNHQITDKDAQLAQAKAQLSNMTTTDLGSTMVLQDVSFETGKAVLLSGGVNRLQPLINYLRLSPDTRVRIEGFTDSVGGESYNRQLSLNRANAVKDMISQSGIDPMRLSTLGSGLDKPVATNRTIAGRQSNRRVEITLLKQPGM
jgi:outer membrane protein OmpA-like peptidoglycan-associated protein